MLEVRNIIKDYANHRALDDVSFQIEKGSIFGLLGPNGAGKTSLIRIINQITAPDGGEIIFKGEPLNPKHISHIGYLPEERGLYKKMLIGEQMLYLAQLKGLSKHEAIQKIKYWFEKMEMQTWWSKKVEDLSKGMQQKVQFVATVIHEPELLILDEPFTGFDPVNAEIIKNEILDLNKKGSTIIFSTHRMESVEQLCDSIVLLNKAKKVLDGKVTNIKNQYRDNTFQVKYIAAEGILIHPSNSLYEVLESQTVHGETIDKIHVLGEYTMNDVLNFLIPQVRILGLNEIIPSLNEIFIQQVQENKIPVQYA
jgi:ABC-2 type transport system ATP-binding protein